MVCSCELLDLLPCKVRIAAAKMPICCSLLVACTEKVQVAGNQTYSKQECQSAAAFNCFLCCIVAQLNAAVGCLQKGNTMQVPKAAHLA